MGIDLRLLPLDCKIEQRQSYDSGTVLPLERRTNLWPAIEMLPLKPLGQPLYCHLGETEDGEWGYGPAVCDPYDGPLHYVLAADLRALREHPGVKDNQKNRAIWAYLAELAPDWPVVLYWS